MEPVLASCLVVVLFVVEHAKLVCLFNLICGGGTVTTVSLSVIIVIVSLIPLYFFGIIVIVIHNPNQKGLIHSFAINKNQYGQLR